jgi:hypothetical protein
MNEFESVPNERRSGDGRIDRVESAVNTLSVDLHQHILDESGVFDEFRVSIERLAVTAEMHTKLMDRMSNTLDGLAVQNARIGVMEDFRGRTEVTLKDMAHQTEVNKDENTAIKLQRDLIIKGFSILGTLVAALWAVATFFMKG